MVDKEGPLHVEEGQVVEGPAQVQPGGCRQVAAQWSAVIGCCSGPTRALAANKLVDKKDGDEEEDDQVEPPDQGIAQQVHLKGMKKSQKAGSKRCGS